MVALPRHPRQPAVGPGRLTTRGRLVVAALWATIAFAVVAVVSGSAEPATAGLPTRLVVVGSGQTLWELASEVAPHDDPRATISEILDLNDLGSAAVHPGDRLLVPAG